MVIECRGPNSSQLEEEADIGLPAVEALGNQSIKKNYFQRKRKDMNLKLYFLEFKQKILRSAVQSPL